MKDLIKKPLKTKEREEVLGKDGISIDLSRECRRDCKGKTVKMPQGKKSVEKLGECNHNCNA